MSAHNSEITSHLNKFRDKSQEMMKHERTILDQYMTWGRGKSDLETSLLQKRDRAYNATNFQDLGIKFRE